MDLDQAAVVAEEGDQDQVLLGLPVSLITIVVQEQPVVLLLVFVSDPKEMLKENPVKILLIADLVWNVKEQEFLGQVQSSAKILRSINI